jgi:hypothetical protein
MHPMAKPPPVTDIRDVQVIKHDRAFFLSDRFGDVPEDNQAALGLYFGNATHRVEPKLEFDADFLDVFEVRGWTRKTIGPGQTLPPQVGHNSVPRKEGEIEVLIRH